MWRRKGEGGRCSGQSSFSVSRPCPLRPIREMFPKSHLSILIYPNYCPAALKHMFTQVLPHFVTSPSALWFGEGCLCSEGWEERLHSHLTHSLAYLLLQERKCPHEWRAGDLEGEESCCLVYSLPAEYPPLHTPCRAQRQRSNVIRELVN